MERWVCRDPLPSIDEMDAHESRIQSSPPADDSVRGKPRRSFRFWQCFWLTFLVVSLGYAWYCFYVPGNEIAWADDYGEAQQLAGESGRPIILFFTGEWCVPCRVMKRSVWADEVVREAVNAAFVPVTIDVGDPAATVVVDRYGVRATPHTIITDAQGNVLDQAAGGIDKSGFLALLERATHH